MRKFLLSTLCLLAAIVVQAQDVKAGFTAQEAIALYYQDGFQTEEDFATWSQDTTKTSRAWYQITGSSWGYDATNPGTLISSAGDKDSVSNEWIISPAIDVKAGSKVAFHTKFSTSAIDKWNVIFHVIDGTEKTALLNFRDWAADEANAYESGKWRQITVDVSAYEGKNVKFAFQYITESAESTGAQAYLDNFTVGVYQQDGVKASIAAGDSVQFVNTSTGDGLTYEWTFAGGTPATSTAQNPVVYYSTRGDYDVTLTVKNSDATDTKTIEGFVHVGYKVPTAAFGIPKGAYLVANSSQKMNVLVASGNHEVTLTDASTDDPTEWQWVIDEDTLKTQNPTYNFNVEKSTSTSSKAVKVELTVSNPAGSNTISQGSAIKVGGHQWVWNNKLPPSSTTGVSRYYADEEGTSFIGGYNTLGITKWAERFDAPMDTITISSLRLVIPGAAVTSVNIPVTIQLEDENGLPGTTVFEGALTKIATNTKSVRGTTNTVTIGSLTNNTTKFNYPLITKPFFITIDATAFPEGRSLAAALQERAEDNATYYQDSLGQWREWTTDPFSLYIQPQVEYATNYVEQAIENFTPVPSFSMVGVEGDVAVVEEGQTVRFSNTSKASANDFGSAKLLWEFEGGIPATSTELAPQVKYTKEGSYGVKLTVTNEFGQTAVIEKTAVVEVTEPQLRPLFTAQEAVDNYYAYDFNSNDITEDGWTLKSTEDGKEWYTATGSAFGYDPTNPGALISHTGNKTAVSNEWAISPEVTVKAGSKASFYVKYTDAKIDQWNTFFNIIDGDVSTPLFDFRSWAADEANGHVNSEWEKVTVDLSYFEGKTVKFGFQYVTESTDNTGGYAYVDALEVGQYQLDSVSAKIALDDSVHFVNNSTGRNLTYEWTFADGQPATSTDENPVVKYTTLGDHTVTLVVTDTVAQKSETKTIEGFVHVGYKAPIAAVQAPKNVNYVFNQVNPFVGPGQHELQFTDASENYPTAWKWEITTADGDVVATSTEQNPKLPLTVEKDASTTVQYNYSLVVSNEAGQDSIGVSQGIKAGGEQAIWASRVKPSVSNIYAYTDEIDGKTGYIGGTNDWGITKWAVRYEAPTDTATIDYLRVIIPTTINKTGLTLTINEEDEQGLPGRELLNYAFTQTKKASTFSKTSNFNSITLKNAEYVPITKPFFLTLSMPESGTLSLGGVPQENAEDNSTYMFKDGQWQEWDGEPFALLLTPTLSYLPARIEQAVKNFTPTADFAAEGVDGDAAVIEQGESLTFVSKSSNGEQFTYAWTFEGGQPETSTEAQPVVTYATNGTYNVMLTVTNEFGFSTTVTKSQYVEVTEATAISNVTSATESAEKYDLNGRRIQQSHKGIYLQRHADGTVTKHIKK